MKRRLVKTISMFLVLVMVLSFSGCSVSPDFFNSFKNIAEKTHTNTQEEERDAKIIDDYFLYKFDYIEEILDAYYINDYDKETVRNAMYQALFDSIGDRYADYYTAEELKEMDALTGGYFVGIGVNVDLDTMPGRVVIEKVIEGGPSEKVGLEAGDVLYKVDGVDISDVAWEDIRAMILGEEGTNVKVTVLRNGSEEKTFDITRGKVEETIVASEILDDNIGYIVIAAFYESGLNQFKKAIDEMNEVGVSGIIIELRDNPGGQLTTVSGMLDYILPKCLLMYALEKDGTRYEERSDAECHLDVPCAVIVNGNSASASELFSGAMQDYDKAKIVGTQTFGKGIVQSTIEVGDGSAIKFTTAYYYTPKGRCIHGTGITPDIVVEFDKDAYAKDGTDTQLQAAIDYIKSVR